MKKTTRMSWKIWRMSMSRNQGDSSDSSSGLASVRWGTNWNIKVNIFKKSPYFWPIRGEGVLTSYGEFHNYFSSWRLPFKKRKKTIFLKLNVPSVSEYETWIFQSGSKLKQTNILSLLSCKLMSSLRQNPITGSSFWMVEYRNENGN